MSSSEVLTTYITKLNHPLKEIRERSLQLLINKLRLGWKFDDELEGTRELFEALLAWFNVHQPSLQREALELLLSTIKTKAGTYIVKEFGVKKILASLNKMKGKIELEAQEVFDDILDTLRFLNTVESEDNMRIPRLKLPSTTSSDSEDVSNSGYYNLGPNFQSSKETSISNGEIDVSRPNNSQIKDGIRVLLFPWVVLSPSDSKTLVLVEDAMKLLKSTRRCCRFIRDVFLRDFPAEIFLNRPALIKSMLSIAEGEHGGRPAEALNVLFSITRALHSRLLQLSSVDLIHETIKVSDEHKGEDDDVNIELEQMTGVQNDIQGDDILVALKQMPAPIFALDTLNSVLSIMARSIILIDTTVKSEVLDLKELNICLCLVESLVSLLLDCVLEEFWCSDHSSRIHRDIAHKGTMVIRVMGDILMKYRKSFLENNDRSHHRVAWLRLVICAERLLHWARDSALPPSSLVVSLQTAQLDPAIEILYPSLGTKIAAQLQNSKIPIDQEYKTKYKELAKLTVSMNAVVEFMKNTNTYRYSKKVFANIKKSLPVLELHLSESYINDITDILLYKNKDFDLDDSDWSEIRSIALSLMAHNIEWVRAKFYRSMAEMVRSVLISDDANQSENEKSLTLLCDVGVLTEICCHGLSSSLKEVESSACDIILYLIRGRLALSESCWWRLLASLLPVLPLLQVYAAHDTQLGQAICKSLDLDIAECMGVSVAEVISGLVRLLFVRCVAVQLDAAHSLCRLLDDGRYLPPKESLRADVLLNALKRVIPQDFNVDTDTSPSKTPQTTGLMQILDVLKQDIVLDEHGLDYVSRAPVQPALEPSLRRSTLQQLSVMLRRQELHEPFLQCDGLKVVIAVLRMSLMVDDYLAFPECAISCVSILNSVCFAGRHTLAKIPDLHSLLIRVILVFPANDSAVLMAAQVLSLVAWSGFALQELDECRKRVPALPLNVAQRTTLPFPVNSYWNTSPNAEHSSIEWLLTEEDWRACIRVRWWCAYEGPGRVLRGAPSPPAPLALRPTPRDLASLRAACPIYSCTKALLHLENATAHTQVNDALCMLESYTYLLPTSSVSVKEFAALPWQHTRRFLCAPPASSRDTTLLIALLHFLSAYIDNVANYDSAMIWIKSYFIGNDATILSLLSREHLYPQQTAQENIEVTQLHICIVKVLLKCVVMLEYCNDYSSSKLESLLKILLSCLEKVDLKNFHMLGYLNELMRCIRYAVNSRYCKLSEDTSMNCMKLLTKTLSGCASGGGRKGQACRLDAMLSLLALLRQIHQEAIPVQRWSEAWSGEVVHAVVSCSNAASVELRASALHVMAALAHYTQLIPQLLQAVPAQSLSEYASRVISQRHEANVVRAAAASLLAAVTARASPHSDVLEYDVLEQFKENNFLEIFLEILVDFCNEERYENSFEPNVPLSVLERRSELEVEVRAQKCGDVLVLPSLSSFRIRPPPTAALVVALTDVVHNTIAFKNCPVQLWNEQGLYRMLFRCASWSSNNTSQMYCVRAAACRALVAATSHKCVRTTLAATKDCLHNLLTTLTPFHEDEINAEWVNAYAQALLLIASILVERPASDTIWSVLKEKHSTPFFHLLLQCLDSEENELQEAGVFCMTQLAQSTQHKKHPDKTKDDSLIEFFDNLPSPLTIEQQSERCGAGDGDDCHPEYLAEHLCKVITNLYQKLSLELKKYHSSQDDSWTRLCSCLSSLLSMSRRSRMYAVHRQFPRVLLSALQGVRDHLSVQGKPVDVIRNANHNPVLRTLYWLLTLIECSMVNCDVAKDAFAEDNIAVSLNRLWPWCMMTEQLRAAVMHLLATFTNNCAKAWGVMSSCVGGRSLLGEVCALTSREAALQSRTRAEALLLQCLRTLRYCASHHHCRAIMIKSSVLSCMYKLRLRGGNGAGSECARLCETIARYPDGATAVLGLRSLLVTPPVCTQLMPALAHAAHHHRVAILQSPDLLELLSGTLVAGDTTEIVCAARAVWALAANNHKAKLLLRSAGVSSAVQTALQRLQHSKEPAAHRAVQLLTYTNTVLQAT